VLDAELDDYSLSLVGELIKGSGDGIKLGILCRLDTCRHTHREGRREGRRETERE
jgi:hypothetical protein